VKRSTKNREFIASKVIYWAKKFKIEIWGRQFGSPELKIRILMKISPDPSFPKRGIPFV
jgi:hypothetical protein